MENITIEISTPLLIAIASSRGWTQQIEDISGELIGDEYPLIDNPITYQDFMKSLIPEYIKESVLVEGRKRINNDFNSIAESVKNSILNGDFDDKLLLGDIQGIKDEVFASLE